MYSLREKYKKVLHVHHDLDLEVSLPPTAKEYGTMEKSGKRYISSNDIYGSNEDDDADESSLLLQLKLERASAQANGVALVDFSSHRGIPEAYCSMSDLSSAHIQLSPKPDRGLLLIPPLILYQSICVMITTHTVYLL